mmetsp:Transcript_24011/g.60432  ORF Transcript_24011/g.60432 Transcript_24011/m.60432 type:complete len:213 (-) Transcript_24011:17-655(-)
MLCRVRQGVPGVHTGHGPRGGGALYGRGAALHRRVCRPLAGCQRGGGGHQVGAGAATARRRHPGHPAAREDQAGDDRHAACAEEGQGRKGGRAGGGGRRRCAGCHHGGGGGATPRSASCAWRLLRVRAATAGADGGGAGRRHWRGHAEHSRRGGAHQRDPGGAALPRAGRLTPPAAAGTSPAAGHQPRRCNAMPPSALPAWPSPPLGPQPPQ